MPSVTNVVSQIQVGIFSGKSFLSSGDILLVYVKYNIACSVGWGWRIHRLLLWREVRLSPTRVLDMTLKMLELRGMRCTPSLPSLPGLLCSGEEAPDRVLSMSRIKLNCVLMINWIDWNRTALTLKLRIYAKPNCFKDNCFWHWN